MEDGLGTVQPAATSGRSGPTDRCAHARRFTPDYDGCATYQPTVLIATDSLSHPLAPALTCRHLEGGTFAGQRGRFYPRCSLGTAVQRIRWLAQVTPQRAAIARLLEEEFERASRPHRQRLLAARGGLHEQVTTTAARRAALEAAVRAYVDVGRQFVTEHASVFAEIGLDSGQLIETMEEMGWSCVSTPYRRPVRGPAEAHAGVLPPIAQAFLGPLRPEAPANPGAEVVVELLGVAQSSAGQHESVDVPGALRCRATDEPDGIGFEGDIDAATTPLLEARLATASPAGEHDIHVDLSGVVFCDIGGLRAIVAASRQLTGGRRFVLHGMPTHMRRVMHLAGWSDEPTLVDVDDRLRAGSGAA